MAQSLEVNIKTTSDVPKAMDKAKAAVTGFDKQVQDIGKKFSTSFKDIFLSFLGPMAILTGAIALVSKMIADNQKKQEEANQAAIDGTNKLMSAEDRYWANKRNNEKKASEQSEQAAVTREETTRQFMVFERERAFEAMSETQKASFLSGARMQEFTRDPEYQKKIQALIAEDMKKSPAASSSETSSANGITNFKGPEGFSNVIGVGPNPVMEAMNAQLEIQKAQLSELQKISGSNPLLSTDFTKTPQK